MFTDTHAEAQRVQRDLLRRASPAERISLMRSLSSALAWSSRQSLAQRHPELSQQEIGIRWVELQYGHALASQLRRFLEGTKPCNRPTSSPR